MSLYIAADGNNKERMREETVADLFSLPVSTKRPRPIGRLSEVKDKEALSFNTKRIVVFKHATGMRTARRSQQTLADNREILNQVILWNKDAYPATN